MACLLLPFGPARQAEVYTTIIIGFLRGGKIEIGQRNFLRALGSELPKRLTDDGVVLYFLLVLIVENKYRRRTGT